MRISYLITVKNEMDTLLRLLDRLISIRYNDGDTIVILDDFSDNEKTKHILKETHSPGQGIVVYQHHLNNDYGSHKNFGVEKCVGDFVFQIDADELPSETLLFNIREIIETNKTMELIYVPRINDFRGVTQDHAKKWGWKLTDMEFFRPCENKRITAPIVNFPDYQSRIFKRDINRIKWNRKLHETIVGHTKYSHLPAEEDLSIYHDKTIETQIKTNLRYNEQFSIQDNIGHDGKGNPNHQHILWDINKDSNGILPKIGNCINDEKTWETIWSNQLQHYGFKKSEKFIISSILEKSSNRDDIIKIALKNSMEYTHIIEIKQI